MVFVRGRQTIISTMTASNLLPALVLIGALSSCTYGYRAVVLATPLGTAPPHPPVPADSIALYFDPLNLPDTAYIKLAYLEAEGAKYDGVRELLPKLRAKASALGANAVMSITVGQYQGVRGEFITNTIATVDGDDQTLPDREEYLGTVVRGVAIYIRPPLLAER